MAGIIDNFSFSPNYDFGVIDTVNLNVFHSLNPFETIPVPPIEGTMLFEDNQNMLYEDGTTMLYE